MIWKLCSTGISEPRQWAFLTNPKSGNGCRPNDGKWVRSKHPPHPLGVQFLHCISLASIRLILMASFRLILTPATGATNHTKNAKKGAHGKIRAASATVEARQIRNSFPSRPLVSFVDTHSRFFQISLKPAQGSHAKAQRREEEADADEQPFSRWVSANQRASLCTFP